MAKLSFQWDIKDFGDCDLVGGEHFDLPRFFVTDTKFKSDWKLRVFPAGLEQNGRKSLSILLLRVDDGSVFRTKYSISLLNRDGRRIQAFSSSKMCEPLKFTNSTEEMLKSKKIVKIQRPKSLDEDVLSVLCEVEIYFKTEEFEESVQQQMRGTSLVIPNKHAPVRVTVGEDGVTYYLRYGKLFILLATNGFRSFRIIDEEYPNILNVPVSIVSKNTKICHLNITREFFKTYFQENTFNISARCTIESGLDAIQINITPYLRKLQSDYRHMFSQSEGGDISIAVDGETLRVHKDILSNRCPVFAAMFNQEWREQATQTVTIKDFSYETILAMIEFIYFGGRDDDYGEEVDPAELLKAAHLYQLDGLKNKCEQRLCQSLKSDNIACYAELATVYELPFLKFETSSFITNNKP